jgi:hypothetical protein
VGALAVSANGYQKVETRWLAQLEKPYQCSVFRVDSDYPSRAERAYGFPRMLREVGHRGIPASKQPVERLMRDKAIRARLTSL